MAITKRSGLTDSIRQLIKRSTDWLSGRTPRERVLVVGGVFGALALAWHSFFFAPATEQLKGLDNEAESLETQQQQFQATLEALRDEREKARDPNEFARQAIAELETEVDNLTESLVDGGLDFIAAVPMQEAMDRLQSQVRASDLPRFIRFERKPGEGVSDGDSSAASGMNIEHRQITMVFEAGFKKTLALLRSLERNEVQVVWRSLDYEVTEHPLARVTVRFDIYAPTSL
ncbi:type II secretion system protein M [Spiribacter vilamensis]|uniref:MSHA biogenesis protein MshJ n=1 Tax=Spiribacter vilamensis TaxID=531306 RepID=A0A4Q8D027_9GAMM|nr:type II secretion system protein M [Spiribacter vilamensis]RZU98602.1 MSHA biogenesis protein MshJ [Spiribacter vilamensis]TVO60139.1 type II secretion system protein M [Spiribacter vilamensis]